MTEYIDKITWVIPFVIVLLIISYFSNKSNRKAQVNALDWKTQNLNRRLLTVQRLYLETLQRELANIILAENIETFEKAFFTLRDWESEILRSSEDRRTAEYRLLLEKFPNFEDFDLIGTKHFVRYDDRPMWSLDDVIDRYREISKFLVLDSLTDEEAGTHRKNFDEREFEIFQQRIRSYKDKRLRDEIKSAMVAFRKSDTEYGTDTFESDEYEVTALWRQPHREFTPDNQYGVYSKKLNEFGIYSFFAADNDRTYESYYRSDSAFSRTDVLMP